MLRDASGRRRGDAKSYKKYVKNVCMYVCMYDHTMFIAHQFQRYLTYVDCLLNHKL